MTFNENSFVKTDKNCKFHIKKISLLINALEYSIIESQQNDRQILMALKLDKLQNQSVKNQLKEMEEENKQLLGMLQLKNDEHNVLRSGSNSSCSTMSMVHLQYKYEELLSNYNGLLKILEMRISDIRKYQEENIKLKQETEIIKTKLHDSEEEMLNLKEKFRVTKMKKNNKILRLKSQRDTLAIVHNQLVNILHKQCMEKDDLLNDIIKNTTESEKCLLLQEIRKNNILSYENFQLHQEIEYLQSVLNLKPNKSNETMLTEQENKSVKN